MSGTIQLLSVWGNALEGHLPNGRFKIGSDRSQGIFLVHSNHLSCQLPRYKGVETTFSMALVGNRFTAPANSFPPW
eukprot:5597107-Amphidinium_carterae.1